jgi:hypothetical protein
MARSRPVPQSACYLLAAALALASAGASAQEPEGAPEDGDTDAANNRSAARELGKRAIEAYNARDYPKALDLFRRAHALVKLSTTGLYTARTLVALKRLVEASEVYLEVSRMTLPDDADERHKQAIEDATRERAELMPRIPQLTVSVKGLAEGESVEVTLDKGALNSALLGVARPTDPGRHVIEARTATQQGTTTFDLAEGATKTVIVELEARKTTRTVPPTPPFGGGADTAPAATQTVIGWVAVGLGGGALIAGAVTGGLAVSLRSDLDDRCPDKQCPPDAHDDLERYQALRVPTTVLLVGGAVLVAGGVVLVLTAPKPQTEVSLRVLPWGAALGATF